jgi:hypothetical protein
LLQQQQLLLFPLLFPLLLPLQLPPPPPLAAATAVAATAMRLLATALPNVLQRAAAT